MIATEEMKQFKKDFKDLNEAQKKVIHDALKGFKLSGVALPEIQKIRFQEISIRLSELNTQFENNVRCHHGMALSYR